MKVSQRKEYVFTCLTYIISNSQYGFRSTRSTSMALLDFMEKLGNAIDSKHITLGVFIDLKKPLIP